MEDDQLIPAPTEHSRAAPDWKRAGLKLIPHIGGALDELVFGQVEEARWDRLNQTLSELGESMQRLEISADAVKKEDFAQLLEVVAPAAGRTTSEQKRSLLRDLLLNAVPLGDGDAEWESARMAAELIVALEAPGEGLGKLWRLCGRQPELAGVPY